MKQKLLSVVLAAIVCVTVGAVGYREFNFARDRARVRAAEAAIRDRLTQPASENDAAVATIAGQFVRYRENTVTIRIEEQVRSDGQMFINYREWTGTIYNETGIFRYIPDPGSPNGIRIELTRLSAIRPGERMTVHYRQNAVGPQISSIYILY